MSNLGHIPLYGLLAILLGLSFKYRVGNRNSFLSPAKIIFVFAFTIALLDELNQAFIPGRTASVMDILLDTFGIISGIILIKANLVSL